jgi:hypothetical protein
VLRLAVPLFQLDSKEVVGTNIHCLYVPCSTGLRLQINIWGGGGAPVFTCCLYGCETWTVTLRKEHRLRVSENRVLRRIFGPRGRKWREAEED